MVETLKEDLTRKDVFLIFGRFDEDEMMEKMKEAQKIANYFGIELETILEKAKRIRNGETLGGSVYLNKALEDFSRL